ncbi:MAG TPA: carboxypeptidase regulatory-like domain-containing protein [Pyrinomonadaceae bacterium]|nr:carboxypeptidase regulatory-like domain-containing protein [Pyrinomonadaceae bacterium]
MKEFFRVFMTLVALFTMMINFYAQSGGNFSITKSVIGGGGSTASGGGFSVTSTVGESLAGDELSGGSFAVTSGFWNYTVNPAAGSGVEGDVASRPVGDGSIASNDVIQTQRFQIGLDQPNQSNEFQRADSAPFSSRGDGSIDSTDVVQTQRYLIGLNTTQAAAGPIDNSGFAGFPARDSEKEPKTFAQLGGVRQLRVQSASAFRSQQVVVNILADAVGDESAYGFRVTYNQAVLTSPTTAIGTAGGSRLCNTTVAGQVSCSINNFPNDQPGSSTDQIGEILPGNNQLLLRITFTVAATAPFGASPVGLTNVNASNDAAAALTITSQGGNVTVSTTTAAQVSVGGRILTANGEGIRNAVVSLTSSATGETRTTVSGSFGLYKFENIRVGESYVLTVNSKRFAFANQSRVITPTDVLTDADFIASPE